MPTIGQLTKGRWLVVEVAGETVNLCYSTRGLTGEWYDRIASDLRGNIKDIDALAECLSQTVLEWDIYETDDVKLPITKEDIRGKLPLDIQAELLRAITLDFGPKARTAD